MGIRTLVVSGLLVLALGAPVTAEPDGGAAPDKPNPDAGAPLVVVPNGSAAPTEPHGESTGRPPPRALDSKRTPMPDRLANDHWLQYYPMAPPTPPVPGSTSTSGGGANRVNTIYKGATGGAKGATGGAPPDVPRDSVTRTPEDQMGPTVPSSAP
ncbi:MAG TPA: hypothetical protein VI456_07870 [Polyangia bacterium]